MSAASGSSDAEPTADAPSEATNTAATNTAAATTTAMPPPVKLVAPVSPRMSRRVLALSPRFPSVPPPSLPPSISPTSSPKPSPRANSSVVAAPPSSTDPKEAEATHDDDNDNDDTNDSTPTQADSDSLPLDRPRGSTLEGTTNDPPAKSITKSPDVVRRKLGAPRVVIQPEAAGTTTPAAQADTRSRRVTTNKLTAPVRLSTRRSVSGLSALNPPPAPPAQATDASVPTAASEAVTRPRRPSSVELPRRSLSQLHATLGPPPPIPTNQASVPINKTPTITIAPASSPASLASSPSSSSAGAAAAAAYAASRAGLSDEPRRTDEFPVRKMVLESSVGSDDTGDDWREQMRLAWQEELETMSEEKKRRLLAPILKQTVEDALRLALQSPKRPIDLRGFGLTLQKCRTLFEMLKANTLWSTLKVNSYQLSNEAIGEFCSLIRDVPNLLSLKLESNVARLALTLEQQAALAREDVSDLGAKHLADALLSNTTLTKLCLPGNSIGPDGVAALAKVIIGSNTLRDLNLSGNLIDATSAEMLALALEHSVCLRRLRLLDCKLAPESAMRIFEALESNRSLVSLALHTRTQLSTKQYAAIVEILGINGKLNVLRLICGKEDVPEKERRAIELALFANRSLSPPARAAGKPSGSARSSTTSMLVSPPSSASPQSPRISLTKSIEQLSFDPSWGTDLRELSAVGIKISSISPSLFTLANLTVLNLSFNAITRFPKEISVLNHLQVLNLRDNLLKSIPAASIGSMTNLRVLSLFRNRLTEIPRTLLQLQHLRILDLGYNLITSLPDCSPKATINNAAAATTTTTTAGGALATDKQLPMLPALQSLNLEHNRLQQLPSVYASSLRHLRWLSLAHNQLSLLPFELCNLTELLHLDLDGNTLSTIPSAIVTRGTAAIFAYLRELQRGSEAFTMIKLTITGPERSGKSEIMSNLVASSSSAWSSASSSSASSSSSSSSSTLITRSVKSSLGRVRRVSESEEDSSPTSNSPLTGTSPVSQGGSAINLQFSRLWKSIMIRDWNAGGAVFRIWDFVRADMALGVHSIFVTQHSINLTTFSLIDQSHWEQIDFWMQSLLSRTSATTPLIIVGTFADDKRCDRQYVANIESRIMERIDESSSSVVRFITVNTKSKKSMRELKDLIVHTAEAHGMTGQRLPTSYLLLRTQLDLLHQQKIEASEVPVLEWSEFTRIAAAVGMTEENAREAAQFLHKIGDLLHFDDENYGLQRCVFLDQHWVADCYTKLLQAREIFITDGFLPLTSLALIWKEPLYPPSMHDLLFRLLYKFDIVFPITISQLDASISCSLDPTGITGAPLTVADAGTATAAAATTTTGVSPRALASPLTAPPSSSLPSPSSISVIGAAAGTGSTITISGGTAISDHDGAQTSLVIPQLLPTERPNEVKDLWPTFDDQFNQIGRIFEFKPMPHSFFTRLQARTVRLPVSIMCLWAKGMLVRDQRPMDLSGSHEEENAAQPRPKLHNSALFDYNPTTYRLKVLIRTGRRSSSFAKMLIDNINALIGGWYRDRTISITIPCPHCVHERSFDPFLFNMTDLELLVC